MVQRLSVRFDDDEIARMRKYAADHGVPDLATICRLGVLELLKRKPPKTIPEGVARPVGNPDPVAAGQAGAAARWGKPKQKRRKAADAAGSSGRK